MTNSRASLLAKLMRVISGLDNPGLELMISTAEAYLVRGLPDKSEDPLPEVGKS